MLRGRCFQWMRRGFWVLALCGAAAQTLPPSPVVTTKIEAGITVFRGNCSRPAEGQTTGIIVYKDSKSLTDVERDVLLDASVCRFQVELAKPVKEGKTIEVSQTLNGKEGPKSAPQRAPAIPQISGPLTAGEKEVKGTVGGGFDLVKVVVQAADGKEAQNAGATASGGRFAASLKAGLEQGQKVAAQVPGGPLGPAVTVKANPEDSLARFNVELPLREGDTEVRVRAGKVAKEVQISVLNGHPCIYQQEKTAIAAACKDIAEIQKDTARALQSEANARKNYDESVQEFMRSASADSKQQFLSKKPMAQILAAMPEGAASKTALQAAQQAKSQLDDAIAGLRQAYAQQSKAIAAVVEQHPEMVENQQLVAVPQDGYVKANLSRPLNSAQFVLIQQVDPSSDKGREVLLANAELLPVQSVTLDWGRVRGVFSLGGIMGTSDGKFGSVEPYVGFYIEGTVMNWLLNKCDDIEKRKCYPDGGIFKKFGGALSLFSDIRLTQTAVQDGSLLASGLQAVQSGFAQFGVHVPFRWKGMDWVYRGQIYSWHVGPVLKYGATVPKGGVLVRKTVLADDSKTVLSEERRNGALPFLSGGLRLGFSRYELLAGRGDLRNRQMSPDPIAYVDMTYGPYTQYRTYRQEDTMTAAGKAAILTSSSVNNRLAIEGRVKLPYLPAQVGVDINTGTHRFDEEPNDWRLLVAFRVDAAKALGRVFGK